MKSSIVLLIALSGLLFSCDRYSSISWLYEIPEESADGLFIGTLEQVGMDTAIIGDGIRRIYGGKYDQIHSMLLYKDGLLVLEEYFEGNKYQWDGPNHHGERIQWDKDSFHVIMSCTKSVTSALIGIAVDKGFIKSVDESIFNYLPDHQQLKKEGKENITIEHLLTMTSGLKWDEWGPHGTAANDIDRIYLECQSDPISCILEKPQKHAAGEKFTYNGGGTIMLGEILKNATDLSVGEFSKTYLFEPLRIDSVEWYQFENGTFACDGSIKMTPRDMLRFGITYLNNGTWDNQRIVSEQWVEKSKTIFHNNKGINLPIDDSGKNGYSYSWWINDISGGGRKANLFQASGWGGQEIIVIPDENMVVVFTGGNYTVKKKLHEILEKFVLPAIE